MRREFHLSEATLSLVLLLWTLAVWLLRLLLFPTARKVKGAAIDAFLEHLGVLGSGVAFLRAAVAWPPAVVQQAGVEMQILTMTLGILGVPLALRQTAVFKFVGAVVGAPIWLWGNYFEVWPQVVNTKWLMVCKPLCQSHDPSRARLLKKLYQEWSSQCALQAPQKCLDTWAPCNSDDLITLQQKEDVRPLGPPNRVLCSIIWTDHNFVLRQEEVLALRACKCLVSTAMVTRRGLHVHDNVDLSQPDVRGVNVAKACFTTATVFGVHLCSKWRGQQLRWPEHVGYVGQL